MKKIDKYLSTLPSLKGKKIVITGANSGLGYAIADHSLSKGATLVLACRSLEKAQTAKDNLLKKYSDADISIMEFQQNNIKSCRKFAKEVISKHPDFYTLVLNAGVFRVNKGILTDDGFPMVSGVNSFGTLSIVECMQEFLKDAKEEKRILIQTSLTSRFEKYKGFAAFCLDSNRPYFEQYSNSKNTGMSMAYYYASKTENENIKYLLCEPGISSSNIIRNFPKAIRGFCAFFYKLLFQNSYMGALPAMDMICNPVNKVDHSAPKHLFETRGLPKRFKDKEKHIHFDVIDLMLKELNEIK